MKNESDVKVKRERERRHAREGQEGCVAKL
jgi:hypothetical protein